MSFCHRLSENSALSSFHISFFSLFASVDDKVHDGRIQPNVPSATTRPIRWNTSGQPPINRWWFMLEGDGSNRWNLLHKQWCIFLQVSASFLSLCLFLGLFCTSSTEHFGHIFFPSVLTKSACWGVRQINVHNPVEASHSNRFLTKPATCFSLPFKYTFSGIWRWPCLVKECRGTEPV